MIAIGKDAAAPPAGDAIDGVGEARAERHHAAAERVLVARLHDQMRVVALQRVVHEPEARPDTASGKRLLERVDDARRPERWETRSQPERDVRRHGVAERLPSGVRQSGMRARLAPGTVPATTPPARGGQ